MNLFRTIHASAHATGLPDASVQCIVTSPPYWGLRKYAGEQGVEWPAVDYAPMPGLPPLHIPGCDPDCEHEWTSYFHPGQSGGTASAKVQIKGQDNFQIVPPTEQHYCRKCGGWRGGLGLEPTPEAYIGHMVLVMREMRRVLRDDGTCFVNLGDSYSGSGKGDGGQTRKQTTNRGSQFESDLQGIVPSGLKPKDLVGIPWRFAFAAQADGWYLRSDIIWAKPNPMPESVTDRPTKAHEYLFLLTKNAKYFYDSDAVREANAGIMPYGDKREFKQNDERAQGKHGATSMFAGGSKEEYIEKYYTNGRNLRSVWTIATSPTPFAHFAVFPTKLVEPCILAGTSARGCCPACGAPWVRVVEREFHPLTDRSPEKMNKASGQKGLDASNGWGDTPRGTVSTETVGWQPGCTCDADEPVPCVVLDPFHGSGTTGVVALRLGRAYIGVDISEEYLHGVTQERMGAGVQVGLGI